MVERGRASAHAERVRRGRRARPIRGHEGMRRQLDRFWEAWEGVKMEALEVFGVDDRRFVVDVRLWGKGRRSGAEVDQRFAALYTMREDDNRIARCQFFPTLQAAMDFVASRAV
jgi:ketosteroid isomerase-like protein